MITIDDITCTTPTADRICEMLDSFGVVRIPNFATTNKVASLFKEAQLATANYANYRNPYGECSRFSLEELPQHLSLSREMIGGVHLQKLPDAFPQTRDFLDAALIHDVCDDYLHHQGGFMEVVVFTRDHIPDSKAVYGKLHYDRRHQLKFILYLNDVDETNGAFGCIPASHREGQRLFTEGWAKVLKLDATDPSEIEAAASAVPEDHAIYRLVPCILEGAETIGDFDVRRDKVAIGGPAGTLVIFDTSLLHFGGFVTNAGERWTIKGHTLARIGS